MSSTRRPTRSSTLYVHPPYTETGVCATCARFAHVRAVTVTNDRTGVWSLTGRSHGITRWASGTPRYEAGPHDHRDSFMQQRVFLLTPIICYSSQGIVQGKASLMCIRYLTADMPHPPCVLYVQLYSVDVDAVAYSILEKKFNYLDRKYVLQVGRPYVISLPHHITCHQAPCLSCLRPRLCINRARAPSADPSRSPSPPRRPRPSSCAAHQAIR